MTLLVLFLLVMVLLVMVLLVIGSVGNGSVDDGCVTDDENKDDNENNLASEDFISLLPFPYCILNKIDPLLSFSII